MNYLFFDIECANQIPEKSKICSFGYVLADEKFNILAKEDILINPNSVFQFSNSSNKKFKLLYDEKTFRNCEKFPEFYEKIKSLIIDKNTYVIGFSTINDAGFINNDIKFYDLDLFDYDFYDAQKMFSYYINVDKQISLDYANELINSGYKQNEAHDSLSDAILTMELFKHILLDLKITFDEFLFNFPGIKGHVLNDEIYYDKEILQLTYQDYLDIISSYSPNLIDNNIIKDKKVIISPKFVSKYKFEAINLTKRVLDMGGILENKASKADIFVYDLRLSNCSVYSSIKDNVNVKKIEISDFVKHLGFKSYKDLERKKREPMSQKAKKINKSFVDEVSKPFTQSLGDLFKDFLK